MRRCATSLLSFTIITSLIFSQFLPLIPVQTAQAASHTATWTSQADFTNNNAGAVGGISTPALSSYVSTTTTPGSLVIGSGAPVTVSDNFAGTYHLDTANSWQTTVLANKLQRTSIDTFTDISSYVAGKFIHNFYGTVYGYPGRVAYDSVHNLLYIGAYSANAGGIAGLIKIDLTNHTSTDISSKVGGGGPVGSLFVDSSGYLYAGQSTRYDPVANTASTFDRFFGTYPPIIINSDDGYLYAVTATTTNYRLWKNSLSGTANSATLVTDTGILSSTGGGSNNLDIPTYNPYDKYIYFSTGYYNQARVNTVSPFAVGTMSLSANWNVPQTTSGGAFYTDSGFKKISSAYIATDISSTLNTAWGGSGSYGYMGMAFDGVSTNAYFGTTRGTGNATKAARYGPSTSPTATDITSALTTAIGSSTIPMLPYSASNGTTFWVGGNGYSEPIYLASSTPPSTTQYAVSQTLTTVSGGIAAATLTKSDTPGTGSVAYYMSNDNGATWEGPVTAGTQWNFKNPAGTQLKYKIALTGNATVSSVSITTSFATNTINTENFATGAYNIDTSNSSTIVSGGHLRVDNTTYFITSGTTWTVPASISHANIEAIGGGAGGAPGCGTYCGGAGGGGGGYSKSTNIALTSGAVVGVAIGAGGSSGVNGGNTYFCNSSSGCASIAGASVVVGAKGGTSGGAGGSTTGAVGSITYAGGAGGAAATSGGGGGGAGAPGGAGNAGGAAGGDNGGGDNGGGGGAAGGGSSTAGAAGHGSTAPSGTGNGGTAKDGTVGGSAGVATGAGAGSGSHGSGGGGAAYFSTGGAGNGGNGIEWDATHGAGGGGGGGGECSATGGGNGGLYGGGGGASGDLCGGAGVAGWGGQGIVVVTGVDTTATAQSNTLVTVPTGIASTTLTKSDTVGSGSINYYLSNDNGATWEGPVTPGVSWNFANPNNTQLKYKVVLTGNATVTSISFIYNDANPAVMRGIEADATADSSWVNIQWDATLPTNTGVKFRTRGTTAAQGLNALSAASWSDYYIATSTGVSGVAIKANGAGGAILPAYRYIEIEATLISTDGATSPTLNSVTLGYTLNGPPSFNPNYPTTGAGGAGASQISASSDPNWGKVKIDYSVADSDDTATTPSFQYCLSSCSTISSWNNIDPTYLTGDIATEPVLSPPSYTHYTAYWDAKGQIPNAYSATAQIRVTANDNEIAYNLAYATTSVMTIDTTPPTVTTAQINGSSNTNTVTLGASDSSGVLSYKLSNNSNLSADGQNNTSGTLQATSTSVFGFSIPWTLSSATTSTVYYTLRDIYGNAATSSVVAPAVPTAGLYDVSNVNISGYNLLLLWQQYSSVAGDPFGSYEIWRSTDGTNYTLLTTITSQTTTTYTDTGLSHSLTYYYKVRSIDTSGNSSAFSLVNSAQPTGQSPTVLLPTVTNITQTSATFNGNLTTVGGASATAEGFNYGLTTSYGSTASTTGSFGTGTFTQNITGLSCNTTYHLQAAASNSFGTTASADQTFTTSACAPSAFTSSVGGITSSGATLNGFLSSLGGGTTMTVGFAYGTDPTLATALATTSRVTTVLGAFSQTLTGLTQGATYYYRAYATNVGGTSMGSTTSFVSAAAALTMGAGTATTITQTSATLESFVTDNGTTITTEGFNYGTTTSYGFTASTTGTFTSGPFSQAISNLSCNTVYHFEGVAVNSVGTTTSTDYTFTTSACAPTVIVEAASSTTATASILNGVVTATGGAVITTIGFNYGTTTSYGLTASTTGIFAVGAFTKAISGLSCNTTYHVEAFASNAAGTSTSADETVTTNECTPTISTATVATVDQNTVTFDGFAVDNGTTITSEGFLFGTTTEYGAATSTIGSLSTGAFHGRVSGLAPGTTYHFVAYAANTVGTSTSPDQTFTTDSFAFLGSAHLTGPSATSTATTSTLSIDITNSAPIKEYVFSNNVDLSPDGVNSTSGVWQSVTGPSFSLSMPWTLVSTTTATVYVVVHDYFGNSATTTVVAPAEPVGMTVQDVSNTAADSYSIAVAWQPYTASTTGAVFSKYEIWRSTNGTDYGNSPYQISNHASLNYYLDTNLASTTTYYYKVRVVDTDGDSSPLSDAASVMPSGQESGSSLPPVISNVVVTNVKNSSATVTWDTNGLTTGTINYGTSNSYGSTALSPTYTAAHSVTLTNLTPGTTYYLKVSSTDFYGNNTVNEGTSFITVQGPQITGSVTHTNDYHSAVITWTTSVPADSYVSYDTRSDMSGAETVGSGEATTTHEVTLTSLDSSTPYYFYVSSTNDDGTVRSDTDTFTTERDTTPPTISNIQTLIAYAEGAVVTWDTDKPADTEFEYGTIASSTDGTYSTVAPIVATLTTKHYIAISGLTAVTSYYFRAKAVDGGGNTAVSDEQTFKTSESNSIVIIRQANTNTGNGTVTPAPTGPKLDPITVDPINTFDAAVNVSGTPGFRVGVKYGEVSSSTPTAPYDLSASDMDLATNKTIKLQNLKPAATYHFLVNAVDKDGNLTTSKEQLFTTKFLSEDLGSLSSLAKAADIQSKLEDAIQSALPSINPPFQTTPVVSNITEGSSTVSWSTNIKSYGSLAYATDEEYQKNVGTYTNTLTEGDTASTTTSHQIVLQGLPSDTKYHYSIRSFVFPQVVAKSVDYTFTTKAGPLKPQILDVKPDSFRVLWTTGSPATSAIDFRDSTTGVSQTLKSDVLTKQHDLTAANLVSGHTYEVRVYGYDADGNLLSSVGTVPVTASVDRTLPQVTSLRLDSNLVPGRTDIVQSIVSWKTDKPATSAVYYEEGSGAADQPLKNKIVNDTGFVQDHVVILPSLKPATIYRVQVSSTDQAGNTETLPVRTIVTPQQSESIVDIIFKNFSSTFNFIH